MTELVLSKKNGACLEIVLNRPAQKNAFDLGLAEQFARAIEAAEADDEVKVVVLRGADGTFSSGLDLAIIKGGAESRKAFGVLWNRVHSNLIRSCKVWIVVLERYAINGAAALALAADFLVCASSAFLQIGEIKLGMAAPRNVAWLALRHSEAVAARLCLLGDRVSAQELLRLGIATEVIDDAKAVDRANELASRIAEHPSEGIREIKRGLRSAFARRPAEQWFAACETNDN